MPRPSLKEQRTDEILDAFEQCIVQYGLQGASLERIAQTASVARPILRHYVGNRDDLIVAVARRFVARSQAALSVFAESLPTAGRLPTLFAELFDAPGRYDRGESLLADALIVEANRLPEVSRLLAQWFDSIVQFVQTELQAAHPQAATDDCRGAALSIVSTYFVMGSLHPMTDSPEYRRAAKRSAQLLSESLALRG